MKEFPKAEALLKRLEDAGFEAYYVGGCVRDHLMGRAVHDVDITTNALPEQTAAVFEGYKVIPTGIRHGTVTVLAEGTPYEITTYRVDGSYSDSRRPDSVEFTPDIVQDLARRDFTMNAIAMDIRGNIVDPFGGRGDIEHALIRCVGEPEKRFTEDALRIMRGIRFASQLGFGIEEKTAQAIIDMRGRLSIISRERVREELDKLLCGKDCGKVLTDYRVIIAEIIPEMVACFGFDQFSRYHKYDVENYYDIDPQFGTLDDMRSLVREAHSMGINVIIDLVVNHSSSSHPWFKSACEYIVSHGQPGGEYGEYYNFSQTQKQGYQRVPGSAWYYECQFTGTMPDLNLDSAAVRVCPWEAKLRAGRSLMEMSRSSLCAPVRHWPLSSSACRCFS